MANRHKARESAVEILYAWNSGGRDALALAPLLDGRVREKGRGDQDRQYLRELIKGVTENVESLEQTINKAVGSRSSGSIGMIERNILLLAVWELQYCPDIPYRVIINEALQLTRTYADENARCFVNGVLDHLAQTIRTNNPTRQSRNQAELNHRDTEAQRRSREN